MGDKRRWSEEQPSSLTQQLLALQRSMRGRLAPSDLDALQSGEAEVRSDVASRAMLQAGDTAPDFALPDQTGGIVRLADRLGLGPVVLQFSRGGWCPFCTLQLRAWQDALERLHDAGADLLAILPHPAEDCCSAAERDLLAFPVLSDAGGQVAERYRVAIELPEILRPLYRRMKHDLPRINGTGTWRMPLPSTFVVAPDGRIVLAHVGLSKPDLLEPDAVLAAVQSIPALVPHPG